MEVRQMPTLPRCDSDEDFSGELLGHNPSQRPPDLADTQPRKRVMVSELAPPPETNPEKIKLNWGAFFAMVATVSVALLALAFVPGVFDEIFVMVIVNVIYSFAQAHGFKPMKIFKK